MADRYNRGLPICRALSCVEYPGCRRKKACFSLTNVHGSLTWAACSSLRGRLSWRLSLGEENMSFPYILPGCNQRYAGFPNYQASSKATVTKVFQNCFGNQGAIVVRK